MNLSVVSLLPNLEKYPLNIGLEGLFDFQVHEAEVL